jgi:CO/xanthine dehydrogenase FAD-binding subunit
MSIVNARTIDDALSALADHPDSLLVQGGTDSMVQMNFGRLDPRSIVSLRGIRELRDWRALPDGGTFIGAGLPYSGMEKGDLAARLPALAEAARTVGSPQIRAAGTIGGNLGTASPAGDALPVLRALDATVHLRSATSARDVPVADFLVGVKRTMLVPGELIVGVSIPPVRGWQGYAKVGVRNAMVIAIASACLARDGSSVRLALGAVAPTVVRCPGAERAAASMLTDGRRPSREDAREFGHIASAECSPISDHRSTAAYRTHAVAVVAARLLERSFHD